MFVFQIFHFWCKVIEWEFWVNFETLWLGRKNKSRNIMTLRHHLFFWCWMRRTWWENLSQITFALGVVVAMLCLMLWEKLFKYTKSYSLGMCQDIFGNKSCDASPAFLARKCHHRLKMQATSMKPFKNGLPPDAISLYTIVLLPEL